MTPHTPAGEALTPLASCPPCLILRPSLFLDLDGVLAPIAATPEMVGPSERRTENLRRVADRLGGRIAVVSGRRIIDIDRICEGAVVAAAGVHGLERRRADGTLDRAMPAAGLVDALAAMADFASRHPGLIVEDKGLAVTLHYRQAPERGGEVAALAERLAERHGLALQLGHMVAELKTLGADKGQALAQFMAEPPFIGSVPVMVGDDLTDEDGFVAASRLGGFGVLVGPGRQTAARYSLADSDAVLNWLDTVREG